MYKLVIGRKVLNYDDELKASKIFNFVRNLTYDSSVRNVILTADNSNTAILIIKKANKTYKCVKIDKEDIEIVAKHNWIHTVVTGVDYIKAKNKNGVYVWLARLITNNIEEQGHILHKNNDLFDYRKQNLINADSCKSIENIVMNPFNKDSKSGLSYIHFHKRKNSIEVAFKYKKGEIYMSESSKDFEDGVRGAIRAIVNRKYIFIKEHFNICLWTPEDCEQIINNFPTTLEI